MNHHRIEGPRRVSATLCLALATTVLAGCALEDIDTRILTLAEMPCAGIDLATGAWASHPFPISVGDMGDGGTSGTCGWSRFDRRERLVVSHGLGRTPSVVLVYLSFLESGVGGSLASGDIARIMAVDEDEVVLENRMDEAFFLRLVVE